MSIDSKNGLGHFYKGCANASKENFKLSNSSFEHALKYLDISSEEYPAIYFFRTCNFIGLMNEFLERNNQNILPMLSQAVKDSQEGYKIFSAPYNKNKEFVFLNFSLDLFTLLLNYLVQNNYFFVDFHTGFGIKVAHSLQDITDEYIKTGAFMTGRIRPSAVLANIMPLAANMIFANAVEMMAENTA